MLRRLRIAAALLALRLRVSAPLVALRLRVGPVLLPRLLPIGPLLLRVAGAFATLTGQIVVNITRITILPNRMPMVRSRAVYMSIVGP